MPEISSLISMTKPGLMLLPRKPEKFLQCQSPWPNKSSPNLLQMISAPPKGDARIMTTDLCHHGTTI